MLCSSFYVRNYLLTAVWILEAPLFEFKAFQSKLDIETIVFCLKNAEDNSVIFLVGTFNISYLKAHFKTTNTMVSTNSNMNLISEEWIIDGHIASKKGETFKVRCYPLTMSPRSSHFSIPHPSQDQQLSKMRLLPLHNVSFSLIITPPTPFTMLSFDLVVNFNC